MYVRSLSVCQLGLNITTYSVAELLLTKPRAEQEFSVNPLSTHSRGFQLTIPITVETSSYNYPVTTLNLRYLNNGYHCTSAHAITHTGESDMHTDTK